MLLTHNVNDIDPGVRRLCQIKLYLRQAPDVAPTASKDLMFSIADEDELIRKLKHLDSRVAAFSYVEKVNGDKIVQDSVFIRTAECPTFEHSIASNGQISDLKRKVKEIPIKFIVFNTDYGTHEYFIRILYLWEEISFHKIDRDVQAFRNSIPKGRAITIQLLDRKQKILTEKKAIAHTHMEIKISNGVMTF